MADRAARQPAANGAAPLDTTLIDEIAEYLRGYKWPVGRESEMQVQVGAALFYSGRYYQTREHKLSGDRGTIDLFVARLRMIGKRRFPELNGPRIGIECKVAGSAAIAEQLIRYAAAPELTGLILITSRPGQVRELSKFDTLQGKPFRVVSVSDRF